jgi:hypothetical protein
VIVELLLSAVYNLAFSVITQGNVDGGLKSTSNLGADQPHPSPIIPLGQDNKSDSDKTVSDLHVHDKADDVAAFDETSSRPGAPDMSCGDAFMAEAPIPEGAVEDKVGEVSHASSDAAGDDILEDAPVGAEDHAGHDSQRCAAAADDGVERSAIPDEAVAPPSADLGVFVSASTLFDSVETKNVDIGEAGAIGTSQGTDKVEEMNAPSTTQDLGKTLSSPPS